MTQSGKLAPVYSKMKELSKDPAVRREVIAEDDASQRVDNYLVRRCKGVPKSHLYRILRSGEVRVNGGRVGPDYRLQAGDELRIPPLRLAKRPAVVVPRSTRRFDVLYEDDAIIVLNKPAGRGRARRQRHQFWRHRATPTAAPRRALPRTCPSARPRYIGTASRRQETYGTCRLACPVAGGRNSQDLHGVGERALARSSAAYQIALAQVPDSRG